MKYSRAPLACRIQCSTERLVLSANFFVIKFKASLKLKCSRIFYSTMNRLIFFIASSFTSSTLFDNSERVGISIVGITILSIFMTIFGIIIITVIAVILLFGFKKWR